MIPGRERFRGPERGNPAGRAGRHGAHRPAECPAQLSGQAPLRLGIAWRSRSSRRHGPEQLEGRPSADLPAVRVDQLSARAIGKNRRQRSGIAKRSPQHPLILHQVAGDRKAPGPAFADCPDALNHLTGAPISVFSGFVSGFGDASWGGAIPHVYSSSSHTARASAMHFWGTGPCSEASSSESSASRPNSSCLHSAVSSGSCPAGSTLTKLRYRGKQDVSKPPRSLSSSRGRIRRVRRGTSGYVRLTEGWPGPKRPGQPAPICTLSQIGCCGIRCNTALF